MSKKEKAHKKQKGGVCNLVENIQEGGIPKDKQKSETKNLGVSRPSLKKTEERHAPTMQDIEREIQNKIYNEGYKYFLHPDKILEIYGEEIAKSKKMRKSKMREILKEAMHSIDTKSVSVPVFYQMVEAELRRRIPEVQAVVSPMPIRSSPKGENIIMMNSSPILSQPQPIANDIDELATLFGKTTKIGRKKLEPTPAELKERMRKVKAKEKAEAKAQKQAEARASRIEKRLEIKEPVDVGLARMLERTGI